MIEPLWRVARQTVLTSEKTEVVEATRGAGTNETGAVSQRKCFSKSREMEYLFVLESIVLMS
jgi:hypothetical protein